jgi:hypothetical protein
MTCTRSTMTVRDIRQALSDSPSDYKDCCCVIESINEKKLKKLPWLKTFRIDDISD